MVSSSFILSSVMLALASHTLASVVPRNPPPPTPPTQQACAQAQTLAVGIHRSIAVQQQVLAAAQDLDYQLKNLNPIDQARYTATKNTLLERINNGLGMTQVNQRTAPPGNPSIPGLGAVVGSLQAEQGMVNSLKGNPGDHAIMDKLMADINGGIAKNQENVDKSTQGCQ